MNRLYLIIKEELQILNPLKENNKRLGDMNEEELTQYFSQMSESNLINAASLILNKFEEEIKRKWMISQANLLVVCKDFRMIPEMWIMKPMMWNLINHTKAQYKNLSNTWWKPYYPPRISPL
jgi:hypothetical protein